MCDSRAFVRSVYFPFTAGVIETVAGPKPDVVSALNPDDYVGRGVAGAHWLGECLGDVNPSAGTGCHSSVHSRLIDLTSRLRLFEPFKLSHMFLLARTTYICQFGERRRIPPAAYEMGRPGLTRACRIVWLIIDVYLYP